MSRPRGNCRHCNAHVPLFARLLCSRHYYGPESVRHLYQTAHGRRDWTAREARQLAEMRQAGFTAQRIAGILGRTVSSVENACHREGVTIQTQDRVGRLAAVKRLAQPGRTDREIAAVIGCSGALVCRLRRELGIPSGLSRSEAGRRARAAGVWCEGGYPAAEHYTRARIEARENGWPVGCTRVQAVILAAVEAGYTRIDSAAARTGVKDHTVYSHLYTMRRMGWVTGGGRCGGKTAVWSLSAETAEYRENGHDH